MGIFQSSRTCCFFFKAGCLIMNTTFKRQHWFIMLHFLKLLLHIQSYLILCTTAHGELWHPKRFASILLYLPLIDLNMCRLFIVRKITLFKVTKVSQLYCAYGLFWITKLPHSSFIYYWDTFLFNIHFVLTVFFTSFSFCKFLSGSSYVHKISF